MANSYYQIATTPKLFVSYPLFQFASGGMTTVSSTFNDVTETNLIKLLQLEPSSTTNIKIGNNPDGGSLIYNLEPGEIGAERSLWNFDYAMILGHNFNEANVVTSISSSTGGTDNSNIRTSNIINHNVFDGSPEYDGWSLFKVDDDTGDALQFKFNFTPPTDDNFAVDNIKIGSLMFGKSYEFPQNTTLATTTSFEYGIKQKNTISGSTLSTSNWTKPNGWLDGAEPFGLGSDTKYNFARRTGRRIWELEFDYLAPDKVMPQNIMTNDNNYQQQDNHTTNAGRNTSRYDILDSEDFFTNVIHRTISGHLPMVLQINKDDNSPSNFAIVRINEGYKVVQQTPNLYNIKMTLTEQV